MMTGCGMSRFLEDDEYVLKENKFIITTNDTSANMDYIKDALKGVENYAVQNGNKKILGTRVAMIFYTFSSPEKDNWLNRFIRKNGEAPVVLDPLSAQQTANQIENLLATKGCFESNVTYNIEPIRNRDARANYIINATRRYQIEDVKYHSRNDFIKTHLNDIEAGSLIKKGDCYDQDILSAERDRIAEFLQNEGYFYASNELIRFLIDTTYSNQHLLSIDILINEPADGAPLKKYYVGDVTIYPDPTEGETDTLIYNNKLRSRDVSYKFVYGKEMALTPKIVSQSMMLFPGRPYRPRSITNSYNNLLSLHNFKYIDIKFEPRPDSSNLVDAHVRLLTSTKRKLSASLELSNASSMGSGLTNNFLTSGNMGVETILEYQNKNLWGGAELLKVDASLLVELPKLILKNGASEFHEMFSAFETGMNASLDIPQFLLPFTSNITWQRARPHTIISLGADYQYRNYFERILGNISYGYSWRHNRQVQHQIIPIEITYVKFLSLDEDFLQRLQGVSDLRLKYQYSDHYVMAARYNYIYNNQQFGTRTNFNYFNATIETAGNLLQGLSLLTDGPVDANGVRQLFGVPYSQYVRLNIDAKRYFYHGNNSTFVARVLAGLGLPYANSQSMPYEKSFYGGGPTTMRAWQLRRLGPGGHNTSSGDILERVGDIQLVINLEERFPISGIFEGAVFTDIGNVWLMRPSEEYPNGEFSFSKLYKELAVGIGAGLRLNISILTLRLDFGIPLYDPGYDTGLCWRLPYWKFNQIVTNIGINYPF